MVGTGAYKHGGFVELQRVLPDAQRDYGLQQDSHSIALRTSLGLCYPSGICSDKVHMLLPAYYE